MNRNPVKHCRLIKEKKKKEIGTNIKGHEPLSEYNESRDYVPMMTWMALLWDFSRARFFR